MRSRRFLYLGIGLASLLASPSAHLSSDVVTDEVTEEQCETAWGSSDASTSCSLISTLVNSAGLCGIEAWCSYGSGYTNSAYIAVALEDVDDLNNCDGNLTTDDC